MHFLLLAAAVSLVIIFVIVYVIEYRATNGRQSPENISTLRIEPRVSLDVPYSKFTGKYREVSVQSTASFETISSIHRHNVSSRSD